MSVVGDTLVAQLLGEGAAVREGPVSLHLGLADLVGVVVHGQAGGALHDLHQDVRVGVE